MGIFLNNFLKFSTIRKSKLLLNFPLIKLNLLLYYLYKKQLLSMTFLLSSLVKFIEDFHCHLMSKHKVKEQFTLSCALSFIFNFNGGKVSKEIPKKNSFIKS